MISDEATRQELADSLLSNQAHGAPELDIEEAFWDLMEAAERAMSPCDEATLNLLAFGPVAVLIERYGADALHDLVDAIVKADKQENSGGGGSSSTRVEVVKSRGKRKPRTGSAQMDLFA
jgi:hypothetical protein